jgi:hypothetical protein
VQQRTALSSKPDRYNNVTYAPRLVDQFLTDAEYFPGPGYKLGADGQFNSNDWIRRVRFMPNDLAGSHGNVGPHGHFKFNGGWKIHIPLTDK